jgi:hypothetical protein
MSSCSRHASKEAVGFCINCGELVCAACHKDIDGKSYCQACVDKLFAARTVTPADNAAPASPAPVKPPLSEKKARIEAVPVLQSTKSAEPKAPAVEKTAAAAGTGKSGISWAWWIPPIILGWIGGLVSWLPNKDSEPKTARNMLFTGIGVSALQGLLSIMLIIALIVPATTEPGSPSTVSLKPAEPTDSSSIQPPVQPAVVNGGQPADVSNVAIETPEPEEEAAVRPAVEPKLTPLVTKMLEPSAENKTVSYGEQVFVTIPGGALKEAQNFTISSVTDIPDPTSGEKRLCVYDISFEKQHAFDSDLTFSFVYNPALLPSDADPTMLLGVSTLDKERGIWIYFPASIDPTHNRISIRTPHNGVWQVHVLGDGRECVLTEHLAVY